MSKEFIYSLRLGVDPVTWDQEKQEVLNKFIVDAKIDDINVIINSEELNHGHIPLDEIDEWLEVSKRIRDDIKNLNATVSLNPWTTIQHCDRGRVMHDLKFDQMVDYQGKKAEIIVCPSDLKWQAYIAETFAKYASIKPEKIWLDDDFRHFNHLPVNWGCFCESHMAIYEKELGYKISREDFVKEVLKENAVTKERLVYLNQAQKEMETIAKKINEAVSKESKDTILGLMSSEPFWHQVENRNWKCLLSNLCSPFKKTSRPHLPSYNEKAGLIYIRDFNRVTRVVADMIGSDGSFFPELENYMYSPYAKSNAFTQLQLETCACIGADGILFNFYDMMGNGVVNEYQHQEILAKSKPLLNYLVNNKINIDNLDGIKVLYAQDSVKTRHLKSSKLQDLLPKEFEWLPLLASYSIACRPMEIYRAINLNNEVMAISDQVLRNLSNDEIITLFTNNIILLDGECVKILFERELQYLIKAKSYNLIPPHTGRQTYEEVISDELICNVRHARMTMMQQCGNYYDIEYEEGVNVITKTFDDYRKVIGNGTASSNNFFILPIDYHDDDGWTGQYINYKAEILKKFLKDNTSIPMINNTCVVQLIMEKDSILITNFSLDPFNNINIHLPSLSDGTYDFKITTRYETLSYKLECKNHTICIPYSLRMFETIFIEVKSTTKD
ncbi:MAG: hypothetical protein ACK5KQ_00570 [Anaerorhabdus sp.]